MCEEPKDVGAPMRIAHLCLSNFYIDNYAYQENELIRQHVVSGHDVLVLASTETYSSAGKIIYVEPSTYVGAENAQVTRLPYRRMLPHAIMKKLRMHPGVLPALEKFKPDIILFHGTCGWELLAAANYAKRNPQVRLYVDSHEDWNNSARNFVSREILHRRYYAPILRRALPSIRKILCVSTETMDFVRSLYGVKAENLEFFPLGGQPIPDDEYQRRREATRSKLGVGDDHIVMVQSGKQTRQKKLLESLRAVQRSTNNRLRFYIAGVLASDIAEEAQSLIDREPRATFLGWQSTEDLTNLLCSADVYLQPGTQSATMQHSLCCRCAVILDDVPAHKIYHKANGWLIKGERDLQCTIDELDQTELANMSNASYAVAKEYLDYKKLAARLLS